MEQRGCAVEGVGGEDIMEYQSCPMIEGLHLNINGRIDNGTSMFALCCEPIENLPKTAFASTAEETLRYFISERSLVIAESKRIAQFGGERRYTKGCAECANYQKGEWQSDGLIHYVNLSMYPSPCQCRCTYCNIYKNDQKISPEASSAYEKLFDLIEFAQTSGMIAPDARWQVSPGEIAIHPYRKRIMDLVKGKPTTFYTNCFKFDEDIARNLNENPSSAINLSIDAGLPQTWKKVKGFDNFDTVIENLVNYYSNSARPGQITLKYIVLPGINDTLEDYMSLMEIMKLLKVPHLSISRDVHHKYAMDQDKTTELVGAAAYLIALCHLNGITCDMLTYTPMEQEQTVKLATEIVQSGALS